MIAGFRFTGRWNTFPRITLVVGLFVLLFGCLTGLPVRATEFGYRAKSNLTFHGVSTIRSWTCDTVPVEGTLELPSRVESRGRLLDRLEGFEPMGVLRVPVNSIDCGESGFFDHNENLRTTLRGETHPFVVFDPMRTRNVSGDTGVSLTVVGNLRITDRTKRKIIPLHVTVAGTETLRVTGEFTVSLREYGLKPPRIMLGLISIYDTIRVSVDLRLFPRKLRAKYRR